MRDSSSTLATRILGITVVVTSFGYFIDMFDFFLFNMVRIPSLADLGLKDSALTDAGLMIANWQWAGLLLGAYFSGLVGDKFGRKASLFISIILYSIGTLSCGFVHDVPTYALARFFAGLGLAGELGAGLTLIIEKLAPDRRGFGIMVFIVMGFIGVLSASAVVQFLPWRTAYIIGGAAGLMLLFTRVLLMESGMFEQLRGLEVPRGGLRLILRDPLRLKKYLAAIFLMATSVFIPQILWTLSPELGKDMGINEPIEVNIVLAVGFSCVIVGNLVAGLLSERLKSRKKATLVFLIAGMIVFNKYIIWPVHTLSGFYIENGLLGITFGVWVVGAAWAVEQFGTNIRATVGTTVPNFARALTIPMNMSYAALKRHGPLIAASVIGVIIFVLASLGWMCLSETYGKNLEFSESS